VCGLRRVGPRAMLGRSVGINTAAGFWGPSVSPRPWNGRSAARAVEEYPNRTGAGLNMRRVSLASPTRACGYQSPVTWPVTGISNRGKAESFVLIRIEPWTCPALSFSGRTSTCTSNRSFRRACRVVSRRNGTSVSTAI